MRHDLKAEIFVFIHTLDLMLIRRLSMSLVVANRYVTCLACIARGTEKHFPLLGVIPRVCTHRLSLGARTCGTRIEAPGQTFR